MHKRSAGLYRASEFEASGRGSSAVQEPDPEIQVPGKEYPDKIGQLQPGGRAVQIGEAQKHPHDQDPQQHQPEEGKAEGLKAEEQNTSEEVHRQLQEKQPKSAAPFPGG